MIKLAQNDIEIAGCFQAMKQLRTELEEAAFVPLVRELMSGGYQLAYLRDESQVVCVAGFKICKIYFTASIFTLKTCQHWRVSDQKIMANR